MMKIGDRFKDKTTGKIYIIRMEIDNDTLCLEGENGLGRRLTGKAKFETNLREVGRHKILKQIYFSSGEDDGFLMHRLPAYPPVTIQLAEEPRQG